MPDSKHKETIEIQSFSWGESQAAAASRAGDLKAPPVGDAEQAAGGGPHVRVFDGAAGAEDGTAIGGATGGVWKTTNFETGDPAAPTGAAQFALGDGSVRGVSPDPQAVELENVRITSYQLGALDNDAAAGGEHEVEYDIVGGRAAAPEAPGGLASDGPVEPSPVSDYLLGPTGVDGESKDRSAPSLSEIVVTKMSDVPDGDIEDLTTPNSGPEPGVEVFLKLPEVNGEADDASGNAGSSVHGVGKVSLSDFHFSGAEDGPSGLGALEPEPEAAYLEMKLHAVKVTSYSVNGSGLDDATEEPSTMAALEPTGGTEGGEETYLAIKLENTQLEDFDPQDAFDADGGTESVDDWEDAL